MDSNLKTLVDDIVKQSKVLCDHLTSASSEIPSFTPEWKGYPELPREVQHARKAICEAANALSVLASGPAENIFSVEWKYLQPAIYSYLLRFKIPEHIPLHGSISYGQLAQNCSVDVATLKRVLRCCRTMHLFSDSGPHNIAHNAFSAVLATDPVAQSQLEYILEEHFPATVKFAQARERWPEAAEANHTPWNMIEDTDLSFFEFLIQPEQSKRAQRYSEAMAIASNRSENDPGFLVRHYDWDNFVGTVADIGGGVGRIATELVGSCPKLKVLVEDMPHVVADAYKHVPADIAKRLSFIGHDFFQPQPPIVLQADKYLLRWVLHDHPDNKAAAIIRNLLPGLGENVELLIVEPVLLAPGLQDFTTEKAIISSDMNMMLKLGGKERSLQDWEDLLRMVSPALRIKNVITPQGSTMSIIVVRLDA